MRYEVYHFCRLILVVVGDCKIFYDLPVCHIGEIWGSHMGVFSGFDPPEVSKNHVVSVINCNYSISHKLITLENGDAKKSF